MFNSEALKLNRIDISDCQYKRNSKVVYQKIFMLAGMKYLDNQKYYMIVPVSYYNNYDEFSNFTSKNLYDILLSKRAIDVTESEYKSLLDKNYIFNSDKIIEDNYPVVIEGEYNENEIVILSKINLKIGTFILFSTGDGRLCFAFQDELFQSKKSLKLINGTKVSGSSPYIRPNNLVVKYDTFNGHILLFSHLRMETLKFLDIDCTKYTYIKEADEVFNVYFKYVSKESLAKFLGDLSISIYVHEVYNGYEIYNINRLLLVIIKILPFIGILPSDKFLVSGIMSYYYTKDNIVNKIVSYGHKIYEEETDTYKTSLDYFKIEDDVFKIRAVLPSYLGNKTVYYTLCVDFKNWFIYHEDIQVYDFGDKHTLVIGNNVGIDNYMLSYQMLTDDRVVNSYEQIDFLEKSKLNNYLPEKELSVESLSEELILLGYKKKSRQTIPDYVFMNVYKSAWLNEREFVTLREYISENKKVYQLDLYKDGKYYTTLSGNFNIDAISNLVRAKKSKLESKSVFNVPKIWADLYNQDRNLVYYPSYLFFTGYSSVYKTVRGDNLPLNTSYYTCARFNPTGEYCICYCLSLELNDSKPEILSEEFTENDYYESWSGTKAYGYKFKSYSRCLILMRFATEEEMFNAFSLMFRKRDSKYSKYINDLKLFLLSGLGYGIVSWDDKDLNKLQENQIVRNSLLKRMGYLQNSWKEIYDEIPDDIFNTMIFD